ncbi:fibronectin type III-like domain-contianing protein [Streptomyces sp. NPDC005385]|uniref:fibronectin type III-like domain-contianing protein n=1 Tax=Streptomyces sp. NPDC005385 TaxID=3157039 RepID=UPI0033B5CEFA
MAPGPWRAAPRPVRWFAGYGEAAAQPGQTVRGRIAPPSRVLAHWSVQDHAWRVEPGDFGVHVGSSAADRQSSPASSAVSHWPRAWPTRAPALSGRLRNASQLAQARSVRGGEHAVGGHPAKATVL